MYRHDYVIEISPETRVNRSIELITIGQSGKHRLLEREHRCLIIVVFWNMKLTDTTGLPGWRAGNDNRL